ncbi:MAG: hypothetical protein HQL51_09995 [Magnetococcales bacterium]|nr:hypothetical protein [Magnetococcales bacterium]
MSQQEAELRRDIFNRTIVRYLEVEEETIASTDELLATATSPMVQQLMLLIKRDSEKHREILHTIQNLASGVVSMTPEEMGEINVLLTHHKQIEAESVVLARSALENTQHVVIRHLLEYMLEDERKHVTMTEQMEDYKRKIY